MITALHVVCVGALVGVTLFSIHRLYKGGPMSRVEGLTVCAIVYGGVNALLWTT